MSGMLDIYFEEARSSLSNVAKSTRQLKRAKNGEEKKELMSEVSNSVKLCENTMKVFNSEIKRQEKDSLERKNYEKKYLKLVDKLEEYKGQVAVESSNVDDNAVNYASLSTPVSNTVAGEGMYQQLDEDATDHTDVDRSETVGRTKKGSKKDIEMKEMQDENEQPELLKETLAIQDDTNERLRDILQLNENTKEIGIEAMKLLKRNTESLEETQKRLDDLGTGIKRAKNELKSFIRGMACDWIIIGFCFLIILVVIALIGLRLYFLDTDIFDINTYIQEEEKTTN